MSVSKSLFFIGFISNFIINNYAMASNTMSGDQIKDVQRATVVSDDDRERLQKAARMLAYYEIEAKKLIDMVDKADPVDETINKQMEKLLTLSESVIDSARFRLPQCDEYLAKSLALKDKLQNISHETLERDYHLDGALPKAPQECYHTKDLFVHPATVTVLTRDDPELSDETRSSIKAEMTEVLAHTEIVRQLVLY